MNTETNTQIATSRDLATMYIFEGPVRIGNRLNLKPVGMTFDGSIARIVFSQDGKVVFRVSIENGISVAEINQQFNLNSLEMFGRESGEQWIDGDDVSELMFWQLNDVAYDARCYAKQVWLAEIIPAEHQDRLGRTLRTNDTFMPG